MDSWRRTSCSRCAGSRASRSRIAGAKVPATASAARLYLASGLQLVLSVGHHRVAWVNAAGYDRRVSLCERYRHVARFDRLVRFDRINKRALRTTQNCGGRHNGGVFSSLEQQICIDELVGPQLIVLVVENRL